MSEYNEAIDLCKAFCDMLTVYFGDQSVMTQDCKIVFDAMRSMKTHIAELEYLVEAQKASNLKLVAALNESEAKLRELEAKPSPTALELMREYSNGKQWALEEAAKICDSTPPHPFRPSIEAAWAIRKLGEGL